jgi:hypothetical protein
MLVTRIGTAPSLASEESWSLSFRKAASIAGVAENGFFLWDKKVFDTRPSSKSVIESDRVEAPRSMIPTIITSAQSPATTP